jgi:hypothetical protein
MVLRRKTTQGQGKQVRAIRNFLKVKRAGDIKIE